MIEEHVRGAADDKIPICRVLAREPRQTVRHCGRLHDLRWEEASS